MKKAIVVIGTRPEAIKLIPVYLALKKFTAIDVSIVSTGQHKEMLLQIFSFFEIVPEVNLELMTHNQSLSQITSLLFTHLEKVVKDLNPNAVFVQGDTTTAMVAAMVGFYNQKKIIHIEAGLRSYNKNAPFPEEINRKIISQVADINFVPTRQAEKNLIDESIAGIYLVGNTVIDSLLLAKKKIDQTIERYISKFRNIVDLNKNIVLITAHRRESFGTGLENICKAIHTLALRFADMEFVFPVHLNPNIKGPVHEALGNLPNIKLLEPMQYDDMIFMMSRSYIIMTDSGGIQEEAPSFHVPVMVLRELTERPEGVEAGCSILAGTKYESIIEAFEKLHLNDALRLKLKDIPNPYGDGMAAKRIAETLTSLQ